ncbi:MAG: NADH-quinone oxidoreductase subunit C [Fimbriiglobus sp.]|jgi:NADH-quinone oxidoreductase subunit C|nr:NADH-quinone oxidoreductase subunit C [Fimbriiglobus sp.]
MTPVDTIALLQSTFGATVTPSPANALAPFVTVDPTKLVEVCSFLRDEPRLRFEMLNDVSGVDYLEPDTKKAAKAGFDPHVEVVYHLSSFRFPGRRFTLKVVLPRWKNDTPGELPEVPTVSGVWAAADWHEREAFDLVGIRFVGHPDPRRILMSDDWVGHPLRKDYEFPLEYHDIRCR